MKSVTARKIEYICEQIPQLINLGLHTQAIEFAFTLSHILQNENPAPLMFEFGPYSRDVSNLFMDHTLDSIYDNKITLIKQLRNDTGAGLKEAKKFVENEAVEWVRNRI